MDKYVFLKVLENQDQVMIDPEYVIVPLLLHHDLRVFDYKRFLQEFHDKFFPRITCMVPTLLIWPHPLSSYELHSRIINSLEGMQNAGSKGFW